MLKKLATGMALALACLPAMAESGFYAGLGLGQVTLEDSIGGVNIEATDTGFKLFGGYRLNDHVSFEAAYIDAGTPDDTIYGVTVEADGNAIQASAIGTIPIGDRFGIYLRASIISWETTNSATDGFSYVTADNDGTDFGYGIGAALKITSNFSLRGEFEGADLDGTDLRLLSIGGLFSF
jgi:OmpA-OmpF porin, OOP family